MLIANLEHLQPVSEVSEVNGGTITLPGFSMVDLTAKVNALGINTIIQATINQDAVSIGGISVASLHYKSTVMASDYLLA
jgi:hypothetical protein